MRTDGVRAKKKRSFVVTTQADAQPPVANLLKRRFTVSDQMDSTWVADLTTPLKHIQAITETYRKQPGDDIYANTPVNYLKLDVLPELAHQHLPVRFTPTAPVGR